MERRRKSALSVDDLVRDLYGSLCEETRFEEPLHRLGVAFRSHISGLHTEDFGAHRGRLTLVGDVTTEEYMRLTESYSSRWAGQNLWMERSLDGFLSDGFQNGDVVVNDAELRASAYYRHFLKPLDIRRGLGICLWNDDQMSMAVASFHRGHGDVGYDANDVAVIHHLRPHLVNAYAIHRRFAKLRGDHASMRASFDRAPLGMLVLDQDGCVVNCNAAAERLLSMGNAIRRGSGNKLRIRSRHSRLAFNQALARLCASPAPMPESILIKNENAGKSTQDLVFHLCAFPEIAGSLLRERGKVLGFLSELRPEQKEDLNTRIVRQILGLTLAETRATLALHQYADVGAAALALGVSTATVRSQLKMVFRKVGIHKSGDLILLVERIVASSPR